MKVNRWGDSYNFDRVVQYYSTLALDLPDPHEYRAAGALEGAAQLVDAVLPAVYEGGVVGWPSEGLSYRPPLCVGPLCTSGARTPPVSPEGLGPELLERITMLATNVSMNEALEGLVRSKRGDDPDWAFLNGGQGAQFYTSEKLRAQVRVGCPPACTTPEGSSSTPPGANGDLQRSRPGAHGGKSRAPTGLQMQAVARDGASVARSSQLPPVARLERLPHTVPCVAALHIVQSHLAREAPQRLAQMRNASLRGQQVRRFVKARFHVWR